MKKYCVHTPPEQIRYFDNLSEAKEYAKFYFVQVKETETNEVLFDFTEISEESIEGDTPITKIKSLARQAVAHQIEFSGFMQLGLGGWEKIIMKYFDYKTTNILRESAKEAFRLMDSEIEDFKRYKWKRFSRLIEKIFQIEKIS